MSGSRRRYPLHNITFLYYLTNKAILSVNVFILLMVPWFFRLCYHLTVITKSDHKQYNQGNYPKSHNELPKLNNFLYYFKGNNILDFHSGVINVRLLHTSPINNSPSRVNTKSKVAYKSLYQTKSSNLCTQWVPTHCYGTQTYNISFSWHTWVYTWMLSNNTIVLD